MATATLDPLRGPATRTLSLPRGSLRPPIENWEQSDRVCRICSADRDRWTSDRPLYKVASPRVAGSRGPRGWIALCIEHGADPRIHAPVRTSRRMPSADHSVTLAYTFGAGECTVRRHVVAAYGHVEIFECPARADRRFAQRLAGQLESARDGHPCTRRERAIRFDLLVPEGTPTGHGSPAYQFARDIAASFAPARNTHHGLSREV